MKRIPVLVRVLFAMFFLWSCQGCGLWPAEAPEPSVTRDFSTQVLYLPKESDTVKKKGDAKIDYGNASQGYVIVHYDGKKKTKIRVTELAGDEVSWDYDADSSDGKEVLPLQGGSGRYKVLVAEHISGNRYAPLLSVEFDAEIKDELLPFLYAGKYAMFEKGSDSVEKAGELSEDCDSDIEVLNKVYSYVKNNITYDKQKAETVKKFYTPNPDETLKTGKGICFDYASLVGALLRANGIPAQVVIGKVAGDLNHAWNKVYLENEGWVDVRLHVDPVTWELIDVTFAAGMSSGALEQYIGSGDNYLELKFY